jgi:hypothetical protein
VVAAMWSEADGRVPGVGGVVSFFHVSSCSSAMTLSVSSAQHLVLSLWTQAGPREPQHNGRRTCAEVACDRLNQDRQHCGWVTNTWLDVTGG